jgi:hypothetical protein
MRFFIIFISSCFVMTTGCKKKSNSSKLQSEVVSPSKDYAPGSLEVTECIESKAN